MAGSKRKQGRKGQGKPAGDKLVMRNVNLTPTDSMVFRAPREMQVYTVSRRVQVLGLLQGNGSTDTTAALAFQFSSIDDATSLTNVFDQYRIDCIEVILQMRAFGTLTSLSTFNTTACSVVDYDDATAPTSYNPLLDYANCIETNIGQFPQRRTFKPHVASALYNGAFTGYGNLTSPWIDAASPDIYHYGVKAGLKATAATVIVDAHVRVLVSLRASR